MNDLTSTETGVMADWIMGYLEADSKDCHTNIEKVTLNYNDAKEVEFDVEVCDPPATYRVTVAKV